MTNLFSKSPGEWFANIEKRVGTDTGASIQLRICMRGISNSPPIMSQHHATILWQRNPAHDFLKGKYSREHTWAFDGGLTIPASPSPSVVPTPWSNPAYVDPEEAFVASISSCHMLTYLYLASREGFQIDSYRDEAIGHMTKNERGVPWISKVVLNPKI